MKYNYSVDNDYIVKSRKARLYIEINGKMFKENFIKTIGIMIIFLLVLGASKIELEGLVIPFIMIITYKSLLLPGFFWKLKIENNVLYINYYFKKYIIKFEDLINIKEEIHEWRTRKIGRTRYVCRWIRVEYLKNDKIKILKLPIGTSVIKKEKGAAINSIDINDLGELFAYFITQKEEIKKIIESYKNIREAFEYWIRKMEIEKNKRFDKDTKEELFTTFIKLKEKEESEEIYKEKLFKELIIEKEIEEHKRLYKDTDYYPINRDESYVEGKIKDYIEKDKKNQKEVFIGLCIFIIILILVVFLLIQYYKI